MNDSSKPVPAITPEMAPFFEGAKRGRLVLQKCNGCDTFRFPARDRCSACLSRSSTWETVSGRGEVYSVAVMHQVYHPGFAAEAPYAVAIVKLEEGPKLTTSIPSLPASEVTVGMPVEVAFEKRSPEVTLPVFCVAIRAE